jgi:uncharacterized membrane protein
MQNVNIVTLVVAILGAAKIILQGFGLDIIQEDNINAIANGVAAVVTVVGVFKSHKKKPVPISLP